METKDHTTCFSVDQSLDEGFDSITNVRGWRREEIDGSSDKFGGEFKYHYKDITNAKRRSRARNRLSRGSRSTRVPGPKTRQIFLRAVSKSRPVTRHQYRGGQGSSFAT
jgi:hypothetical protein